MTPGVVDVLRARTLAGSRPGQRADAWRVALVLEGGGMRGVVSAGMTAAIERLGMTGAFDLGVGASAGALNAAALLAGVARSCAAAYHGAFTGPAFINPARSGAAPRRSRGAFPFCGNEKAPRDPLHRRPGANCPAGDRAVAAVPSRCRPALARSGGRNAQTASRAGAAPANCGWVGSAGFERRGDRVATAPPPSGAPASAGSPAGRAGP